MSTRSTRRSGASAVDEPKVSTPTTRRGGKQAKEVVEESHESVRKAAKPPGTPKNAPTPRRTATPSSPKAKAIAEEVRKKEEPKVATRVSARQSGAAPVEPEPVKHTPKIEKVVAEKKPAASTPTRSTRNKPSTTVVSDVADEAQPMDKGVRKRGGEESTAAASTPIIASPIQSIPIVTSPIPPPAKKSKFVRVVSEDDDAPPVLTRITMVESQEEPTPVIKTSPKKFKKMMSPRRDDGATSPELGASRDSPEPEPIQKAPIKVMSKPVEPDVTQSPKMASTPIHAAMRLSSTGTCSGRGRGIRSHTVTFGRTPQQTLRANTARQLHTRTVVPITKQPTPNILGGKSPIKQSKGVAMDLDEDINVTGDVEGVDVTVQKIGTVEKKQLGPLTLTKYSDSQHITVEAPDHPVYESNFKETPLPGPADEVESYPCKYCADRVFLTSFGLERHTKMGHPDKIEDVLKDIARIQEEWKKREEEREKQRERLALAKIRQEALAAAAARETLTTESPLVRAGANGNQNATYDSCGVCGLLINCDHFTAMQKHMRAHEKNDQLRNQLMNTLGPEFLARVTCHQCQLVFTDERKLIAHAEAMHVRRRKYVCKWCGHVCPTMTDLNVHKADVHNMRISKSRDSETKLRRNMARNSDLRMDPRNSGIRAPNGNVISSVDELPCKTTCDSCGLVMVKPSLLIRHMMRVHNKTSFTSTVETKGMPPFKITVDKGKLTWTCCGEGYTDRQIFVVHRRSCHKPRLNDQQSTILEPNFNNPNDDYVVLVMGEDGQQHEVKASELAVGDGGDGDTIVLTEDQLKQLGITDGDTENMMVIMDDGEGNYTYADGTPVPLSEMIEAGLIEPKGEQVEEQPPSPQQAPTLQRDPSLQREPSLEREPPLQKESSPPPEIVSSIQNDQPILAQEEGEQEEPQTESQFVIVQDENGEETTIEVPPGMQLVLSEDGNIQLVSEESIDQSQVQYINPEEDDTIDLNQFIKNPQE